MKKAIWLLPLALAAGVLSAAPVAAQTPAVELKVGDQAPDVSLETLDGKSKVQLSALRGKSPVVLIFGSYT